MRIAACTMAYNESVYLPLWVRYYGSQIGNENIYVIDHGSTDGSVKDLPSGINVLKLPRTGFDEYPRTALINNIKNGLTQYYDKFLYTDCDEILVADPEKYNNLLDYCEVAEHEVIAPIGLNVYHDSSV